MSLERAFEVMRGARRIVALTGAGISTPSGIPDFRSAESGLWTNVDAMLIASRLGFERAPERFYAWFRPLLAQILAARPNPAHLALAQLEQAGRLRAVITQNIDGLHQAAGSREVYELHGHLRSATCLRCGAVVESGPLLPQVLAGDVPRCACEGLLKPDVVLFGDMLPRPLFDTALAALAGCDLLLVAGSSLEVEPVAGLPRKLLARQRAGQTRIVVVTYGETWLDEHADAVVRDDVATALPRLAEVL